MSSCGNREPEQGMKAKASFLRGSAELQDRGSIGEKKPNTMVLPQPNAINRS